MEPKIRITVRSNSLSPPCYLEVPVLAGVRHIYENVVELNRCASPTVSKRPR
jgi:hypothetical protein